MIKTHVTRFYLSANTPLGFVSRLNTLCDADRFSGILMLKGGTQKRRSELIRRTAEAARKGGQRVGLVAAPGPDDCLEAAFWGGTAVIDSSLPHSIEPKYPGAVESLLCLDDCYITEKLRQSRADIISLANKEERLREQARRYLCAADALYADNYRVALEFTDAEKIERQADRIAVGCFKGDKPVEDVCIFSDGRHLLPEISSAAFISTVVLLEDEHGPSASLLLAALRKRALCHGCHIICGYSPMAPFERLEQLILPQLSLAFLTANERLPVSREPQRIINARRFTDKKGLSAYKNRIAFNRKAARQMLSQSHSLLQSAFDAHAELEALYDPAFDDESFNRLCGRAALLAGV